MSVSKIFLYVFSNRFDIDFSSLKREMKERWQKFDGISNFFSSGSERVTYLIPNVANFSAYQGEKKLPQ